MLVNLSLQHLALTHRTRHRLALAGGAGGDGGAGGAAGTRRGSRRAGAALGIAATASRFLFLDEKILKNRLVFRPVPFPGGFGFGPGRSRRRLRFERVPEGGLGGGSPSLRSGRGRALPRVALRGGPAHAPERLLVGHGRSGEVVAHHVLATGVQHRGGRFLPGTVLFRFRLRFRIPPPSTC